VDSRGASVKQLAQYVQERTVTGAVASRRTRTQDLPVDVLVETIGAEEHGRQRIPVAPPDVVVENGATPASSPRTREADSRSPDEACTTRRASKSRRPRPRRAHDTSRTWRPRPTRAPDDEPATLLTTDDDTEIRARLDDPRPAPRLAVPTLAGPDDTTRDRRLEWTLMMRAYAVDVLRCPRCAGPMRLISLIEDGRVATRILMHLGLPARAPPRGRPWRPPQRQLAFEHEQRAAGDD